MDSPAALKNAKMKTSRATRTKKDSDKAKEAEPVCDLCVSPFKPAEEVLHYEGSCRKHMHRYCAGLSQHHYLELRNSSQPFVCLICSQRVHKAEVLNLQNEVAALKAALNELRTAMPPLATQAAPATTPSTDEALQALKMDVEKLQTTVSNQAATYANAVSNGRHRRGNSKGTDQLIKPKQDYKTTLPPSRQTQKLHDAKPRVPVKGERKVWGTLRATTVPAVTNSIRLATSITTKDLSIKRKFKTGNHNRIIRWWFVVRGEEATLQKLEEAWQQVSIQTEWKLEPVLRFCDDVEEALNPQNSSTATPSMQTSPSGANHSPSAANTPSNQPTPSITNSPFLGDK